MTAVCVSQKLSPVRVHGPMPKLTQYAFLDPRSNKLSTVNANCTKNYPEVDNWLFPSCVHHSDSSLLADEWQLFMVDTRQLLATLPARQELDRSVECMLTRRS